MDASSPIQERIFKSRLTITYKTNITGTTREENLPFRLLVLGEFAGTALRSANILDELSKRQVHTIQRGSTVDHHLEELIPIWRIPNAAPYDRLKSAIPGSVKIKSISFQLPQSLDVPTGTKKIALQGDVEFSSDHKENGVCDFDAQPLKAIGEIEVGGSASKPTFGVATIRLSGVVATDYLDPATRRPDGKVVGLTDGTLGFKIDAAQAWAQADDDQPSSKYTAYSLRAPNPLPAPGADVFPVVLERVLPFTSIDDFSPDEIVANIPELRRSCVVKALLQGIQSELRNRPDLRARLKGMLPAANDKDRVAKLAALGKLRDWVKENLSILALDVAAPVLKNTAADPAVKEAQDQLLESVGSSSADLYVRDPKTQKPTDRPWALVRWIDDEGKHPDAPKPLHFYDRDPEITEGARVMNALAALLANVDLAASEMAKAENKKEPPADSIDYCFGSYAQLLNATSTLVGLVDDKVQGHLDDIYHHDAFQALEATWRGLDDLVKSVDAPDVFVNFLDVSKDELSHDLVDHDSDIFSGELFNHVYVAEYDRYGGKPFAAMIGLYEFDSSKDDIAFLGALGKVANASHCPFVAAVSPRFFAPYTRIDQVAEVGDLDAVLSQPDFGAWQALRDTDYAAYLGLALPRYLVREPWGRGADPVSQGNEIGYRESAPAGDKANTKSLLWGNAAVLFAQNMIRSYQTSGWAQHIRGPKGGGLVDGLVSYTYTKNGVEEIQPPVEMAIPDFRELQFANNGFIPLVHKKGEAVATFFSAQSLKKPRKFVEDLSTQNAALVTNLAYTFSITRIAHFVKRMMREYIGAAADDAYIQKVLSSWLGQYVTVITNPDDLTLRYYPFKAATVAVEKKPGPLGWYKAGISILPHVQFEGMDVELRLDAALGGP